LVQPALVANALPQRKKMKFALKQLLQEIAQQELFAYLLEQNLNVLPKKKINLLVPLIMNA